MSLLVFGGPSEIIATSNRLRYARMFAVLQTLSGADLSAVMLMRSRALPKMARIAGSECRGGGMADAEDSKSSVRKHVRVQVPPSAPKFLFSFKHFDCGSLRARADDGGRLE